ncbi:hypothetical protein MLD38_037144 [Melastoma candidum]|uniref:Uncharacterized protein n=1 Tax=Melastoma candidum TaxID=119954 RepID=A0ACB9LLY8_9MYRT|nr:hypothetical protein MLD38_037144 [Melastoma candidum]
MTKRPVKMFKNIEEAWSSLNALLAAKPTPPQPAFTSLLLAVSRLKQYQANVGFIERLHSAGLSNHLVVMNILVNSLCRTNRTNLAFSVLSRIFKIGLKPNAVTLTNLLDGLCRDGDFARAVSLVRDMTSRGDPVDGYMIGVIVKCLCRSGNSDMALEFVADSEESGCSFNNLVVYSTCVDGLCKEGRVDEALELLGVIRSKGILPDNVMYTAVIHGLC